MIASSSSHYLIFSHSNISYPPTLESVHLDQFSLQQGEKFESRTIESDCACTDGRSQSIILIPPKDQDPPNRDSK
jgi:hypothetical protein